MSAANTVIERAIKYAELAQAREQEAASGPKSKAAEMSWHIGRAGAYEDMAGLLRMGLTAANEAEGVKV